VGTVVVRAFERISVAEVPTWALGLAAFAAMAVLLMAIVRIFPADQRKRQARRMAGIMVLLVVWVGALRFERESLWLGIVTGIVSLPAILAYGRLPDDFPTANDPRRLHYRNYSQIARRGRRVGYVLVASLAAGLTLSFTLFTGFK
jgi:chromate transport protein ChrA